MVNFFRSHCHNLLMELDYLPSLKNFVNPSAIIINGIGLFALFEKFMEQIIFYKMCNAINY
jgi:hypothetical protein